MKFSDFTVFIGLIPFICLCFYLAFSDSKSEAKNDSRKTLPSSNGLMDKLEYGDHTYIGWTCNLGCTMVHDPDCKCKLKDVEHD